jgi:membrane protease subunit (stomatin/prohibitin family)
MALFKKSEGGLMDVIRCDEQEYLVWKWRPSGDANTTKKENAIRYGSRLRVKEGELAVFFYQQNDEALHDFIIGPHDETIKTANFPILSSIVGLAFGGNSPFQAEIYFINLSGNVQIRFGIPYFDVFDPRFPDLGVPCAVRGTMTFNLTDYKKFIKLNRLINFSLEDFKNQVKDFFIRQSKSVVLSITNETGIPAMQLETKIDIISSYIELKLRPVLSDDFGVNLKRVDIGTIELDKEHPHYQQLKKSTVDQQTKFIDSKTDIELKNLEEMLRIQRKEAELKVEGNNLNVHQLNIQGDVAKTAAKSLGELGGETGGMNTAGMVSGMMLGGTVGSGMSGMMGNIMQGLNQNQQTPPPPPVTQYFIALEGQQSGPFTLSKLQEMVQTRALTKLYHVWKPGMPEWVLASEEEEVSKLFSLLPPPPPVK